MAKTKRKNRTTLERLDRTRRIVIVCMKLSRKKLRSDYVDLIVEHVTAKLPAPLMRRLVKGDCGKPMREAMKLTAPYFV